MKTMPLLAAFLLVVTSQTITAQDTLGLSEAIAQGNPDEVRRSIEAGADVNQKFDLGILHDMTPLGQVCIITWLREPADTLEIIRLLIEAGANANEKFEGMTVLGQAVQTGGVLLAIIEPLVAGGLDIDAKNISGKTALHGAALLGRTMWLEPLIENGADLNAKDDNGRTPLFLAVLKDKKEAAEILITKGANVNAESSNGLTPLDIAVYNKDKDLADLIRDHGGISGNQ